MKNRPAQIENKFKVTHPLALLGIVAVLCLIGCGVYLATKPNTNYLGPTVNGQTPTPAANQPGNPGNSAKSSQVPAATTQTPTRGSITISDFNITPQSNGSVRVQNDQISGAASGSCAITLTSPQGDQDQTVSGGQIVFAGSYYSCSFPPISGVTESGNWRATITVTSGGASGSKSESFGV